MSQDNNGSSENSILPEVEWWNEQCDQMCGADGQNIEALGREVAEHCYWKHAGYRDQVREVTKRAQRVQNGSVHIGELSDEPVNDGSESQCELTGSVAASIHNEATRHRSVPETELVLVVIIDPSHASPRCYFSSSAI